MEVPAYFYSSVIEAQATIALLIVWIRFDLKQFFAFYLIFLNHSHLKFKTKEMSSQQVLYQWKYIDIYPNKMKKSNVSKN